MMANSETPAIITTSIAVASWFCRAHKERALLSRERASQNDAAGAAGRERLESAGAAVVAVE